MTQHERQAVEEAANNQVPMTADSCFHYSDQDIWKEGFIAGAQYAMSELCKPSEPKKGSHKKVIDVDIDMDVVTLTNQQGDTFEFPNNEYHEGLVYFLISDDVPSEPKANVGKPSEELVEKIASLIEADLIQSYAPNFYDEDDGRISLLDLFSHTDTIDSGRKNIEELVDGMDCIEEIANIVSSSRQQENDNNKTNFENWIKQWRDDQQKLVDFQKKNGHPNNDSYCEGGLDMLNKIIQQLESK